MIKYFKTEQELHNYINEKFIKNMTLEEMLVSQGPTDEEIIDALLQDGYVDLNNLVENGHAYEIGEFTNNGWLYEDEADLEYMQTHGTKCELRKR